MVDVLCLMVTDSVTLRPKLPVHILFTAVYTGIYQAMQIYKRSTSVGRLYLSPIIQLGASTTSLHSVA